MAEEDLRAVLNEVGGWDGFEVHAIRREDTLEPGVLGDPSPRLVIELRPVPGALKRCSRCGAVVTEIHDVTTRRIRDLPMWDRDTWLILPRARVRCPRCGPTVEAVEWLDKHQRMTRRLANKIAGVGDGAVAAPRGRVVLGPLDDREAAASPGARDRGRTDHAREPRRGARPGDRRIRDSVNTALGEGINNKSKVMKGMAYGYRDDAYFFLKICAAFPGNP